jgi:hypothetical protein
MIYYDQAFMKARILRVFMTRRYGFYDDGERGSQGARERAGSEGGSKRGSEGSSEGGRRKMEGEVREEAGEG